ncbi:MAG TPA: hypothetical protein VFE46_16290 [Pirellulales bacterium]|jgi:hypothetical protein|nr:hypothetical protein [Pirellulales bacterium]
MSIPRFKLTDDSIVKRLRWVMIAAMLFSMYNTLAGQPARFWLNPEQAIRGDGLRLHNSVNHTFEFFLSRGWQLYALSCLIYMALAFVVVSILPRKAALVAGLSVIFGHYYGSCNWLAVRWHLGFDGVGLYALLLSAAIAWVVSPIPNQTGDEILRRLRWVMFGVMLFDPILTLIGQPGSYWAHPETVHEANGFWRWFMVRGWSDFVLMHLLYDLGAFWLASTLPRRYAVVIIFAFTFGHFDGASNWLFYEWRLGIETPVIYGIVLSSIIVFLSFRRSKEPNSMTENSPASTAAARTVCC